MELDAGPGTTVRPFAGGAGGGSVGVAAAEDVFKVLPLKLRLLALLPFTSPLLTSLLLLLKLNDRNGLRFKPASLPAPSAV